MVAMVASTVKLTLMTVVYFALHQLSAAVRCNVNMNSPHLRCWASLQARTDVTLPCHKGYILGITADESYQY